MNKLLIAGVLGLSLVGTVAFAKNDKEDSKHYAPDSSEAIVSGIYDVAGRDNLKVKVFVHKGNAKPGGGGNSLVCNLADTDSLTITPAIGWKLGQNINYFINPGSAPAGLSGSLGTIANNAFSQWTGAVGGKVVFHNIGNTSVNRAQFDSKNIIAWGRTSGSALAVTYTWYDQSTGAVAETDTIFNDRFAWNWSNQANCAYSGFYDVQDILTHETGHWMGLDDTYDASFSNNTMYGYGSPTEVKKDTLSTGDILGVQTIYK